MLWKDCQSQTDAGSFGLGGFSEFFKVNRDRGPTFLLVLHLIFLKVQIFTLYVEISIFFIDFPNICDDYGDYFINGENFCTCTLQLVGDSDVVLQSLIPL